MNLQIITMKSRKKIEWKNPKALLKLGNRNYNKMKYGKAIEYYEQLKYYNNADIYGKIAYSYAAIGKFDMALRKAQDAYMINPSKAKEATKTLYILYYLKEDWQNVEKWTGKYIEFNTQDAQVYYIRAIALFNLSEIDKSKECYLKGEKIDLTNGMVSIGKIEYESMSKAKSQCYPPSIQAQKMRDLYTKIQLYDSGFTRTYKEFIQDMQDESIRHQLFNILRRYDSKLTWSYYEFYHELGII